MITTRVSGGESIAERLAAKARKLAEAHADARLRGELRWRLARLLWPLFGPDGER